MSQFIAIKDAVWMIGGHHPWRMSPEAVDTMLDLFEREGEASRFNDLYDAHRKAQGPGFIPRIVSFRAAKVDWPAVPDVEAELFNQRMERTL